MFILPTKKRIITQTFGENPQLYKAFGLAGHNGIDLAGDFGEPIFAAADGLLSIPTQEPNGYGLYCIIEHPQAKLHTYYAHCSAIYTLHHSRVKQGELIAAMGSSGYSTGVHLHFGVRKAVYEKNHPYKGYIDPLHLLEATQMACEQPAANQPTTARGAIALENHLITQQNPAENKPQVIEKNGYAQVDCPVLNLRAAPNISANPIGTIFQGTKFCFDALILYHNQDTWLRIGKNLYLACVLQGVNYARIIENPL